jgi:excisionase family DNA binding protein
MASEPSSDRRTVNIKDVAKELGVSIPTAYRLAHRDELPVPVIRVGQRMVVSRDALEAVLRQSKQEGAIAA